jgi:hypothetical protein
MAAEAKIIDEQERDRLVLQMKSYYFPERSHRILQSLCPALATYFRNIPLPDVKRDDAVQLLLAIRDAREAQLTSASEPAEPIALPSLSA